jgi:predicted phage terminase large subunit-like protein
VKYDEGYDYYLLDLVRERLEYPYLKERILAEWKRYGANRILIEDRGSGTGLIQDLKRVRAPVTAYEPQGDKIMRMSAQSAKIEQGFVWLPERADWLEDFRLEVLTFPLGRHDDQVDSLSQLLNWHDERRHKTFRVRRLGI